MELTKDVAQVLALILIGVGLLFVGRRDPDRRRKLTILDTIVLMLAVARVVWPILDESKCREERSI
jgi:hypothetical protein